MQGTRRTEGKKEGRKKRSEGEKVRSQEGGGTNKIIKGKKVDRKKRRNGNNGRR